MFLKINDYLIALNEIRTVKKVDGGGTILTMRNGRGYHFQDDVEEALWATVDHLVKQGTVIDVATFREVPQVPEVPVAGKVPSRVEDEEDEKVDDRGVPEHLQNLYKPVPPPRLPSRLAPVKKPCPLESLHAEMTGVCPSCGRVPS